ncbi:hypothetical protein MesoLjLc_62420 [Mesorhizobium sp. L-8-10]|uniref:hypothetical protein n=1 Tax=Mesorhizobium sp. L-8-10 TaxID=2744523 RepID=UPI0019270BFC|nr:hypothetical protein [Mesorhizobium sp. L-8-10]BCH34312.1 hypothetical protein MesoLjLc_62420 [Mesorhizobium sp. L-8-10]
MTDRADHNPSVSLGSIRVSGNGDARSATRGARDVAAALAEVLRGSAIVGNGLNIESLNVTLPAGAGRAEILRAVRAALARHVEGRRR